MARTWVLLVGLVLVGTLAWSGIAAGDVVVTGIDFIGSFDEVIAMGPANDAGLQPGLNGTYDPAHVLPTGGLTIADLTSGIVPADMIPPDDNGQMMSQYVETIAARMSAPAPADEPGGSLSQSLLEWAEAQQPAETQPVVAQNMAAQVAGFLDSAPGMPTVGGPADDVMSQISGGVQEVFSTLPIPGITNLLVAQ